jgi:hypothetical protein
MYTLLSGLLLICPGVLPEGPGPRRAAEVDVVRVGGRAAPEVLHVLDDRALVDEADLAVLHGLVVVDA